MTQKPDPQALIVLTTWPDQQQAEQMAEKMITAKLAACVNIGSACQSVYEWENKIEMQTEVPLHIKTKQHCYAKIEALILEMHPYELPDIIVLNVHGGLNRYLQWLNKQLSQ
ncbi:MAG: divalent-cation tolerance protein CutA [Methylophilaceae bacterium]|nr:MAG: divalent-cation tolerance protein CutA [Methylophilaceae bacterium]